MDDTSIFEWEGKELAPDARSADWYWALGIVALALVIVCVLLNNILLAIVVVVGSITTALLAAKRPRIHRFSITSTGIIIDTKHYAFQDMLHFSVFEFVDATKPAALSIKTKKLLSPHLLIPIVGHDPVEIYEYVSLHLPEGRHEESFVDRLVEMMGF